MTRSGDVLDLSAIPRAKIDKHSTGGVGDKISIPLAPPSPRAASRCRWCRGAASATPAARSTSSSRSPASASTSTVDRFAQLVGELGVCLIGQTARDRAGRQAPVRAARRHGTVESIPLITSSIMSKKLAEGIDGLVIDVKVGAGAFMKDVETARRCAPRCARSAPAPASA
jgi:thymidine phosphorylase